MKILKINRKEDKTIETYILRQLKENDLKEFNFIAEIHESLPGAWVDNYNIDTEEIQKTIKRLIEKHKTDDIFCYIAEKNDEIISFIWAEVNQIDKDTIDIFSLWTNEKYRGQGIASKLKMELEKWVKSETNAKNISTTVSAKNRNIIDLNKKLDYEIIYHKMVKNLYN